MTTKTRDWFTKPLIVTVVGGLLVGIPVAIFQVKFESKPDLHSEANTSERSSLASDSHIASEITDKVHLSVDSVNANRPAVRLLEAQVTGFPIGKDGVDYNRLIERMLVDRLGGSAYLRGCLLVVRGYVSEGAPRLDQDHIATVHFVDWQLYSGVEDQRGMIYNSRYRSAGIDGTGPDAATAQSAAVRTAAAQLSEEVIERFPW